MSLINDVKYEIDKLDLRNKNLRKFGLTIGIMFILIAIFIYFKYSSSFIASLFLISGLVLNFYGWVYSNKLTKPYKIWMLIAFVLGWFVSRIIISLIFVFVLTPIALLSKIFGKDFLKLKNQRTTNTYWIRKNDTKIDYRKMF